MKKKILVGYLVFALIFALIFGLTSCDEDKDDGGSQQDYTEIKITDTEGKSFLAVTVLQGQTPVAVGLYINGNGKLYEPGTNNYPDTTKPWKGEGRFGVALAEQKQGATEQEISTGTGTINYVYVGLDATILRNENINTIEDLQQFLQGSGSSFLASLSNMQVTHSFNKDNTVTLSWKYFLPENTLKLIQQMQQQQ